MIHDLVTYSVSGDLSSIVLNMECTCTINTQWISTHYIVIFLKIHRQSSTSYAFWFIIYNLIWMYHVADFGTKKMMLYYKICNNLGRISGCLPHGWNWSDKALVNFSDQTTAAWRCNCILRWWCQCRSVGMARAVKQTG